MSILDRSALEQSPLADLHAIASELSLDGYRRLRRPQLIEAIIERQGGDGGAPADRVPEATASAATAPAGQNGESAVTAEDDAQAAPAKPRRRTRRSTKAQVASAETEPATDGAASDTASAAEAEPTSEGIGTPETEAAAEVDDAAESVAETPAAASEAEPAEKPASRRRRRRTADEPARETPLTVAEPPESESGEAEPPAERRDETIAEGVVEVLSNGSAFLRVNPPEPSDQDIYISAAQVKRCELVSGDRISGPRRPPRRSERFASLVRVDAINGRPASEVADTGRFDDLPAGYPVDALTLAATVAPLPSIESLAPFGRGSRVIVCGEAQAGKSLTVRRLAGALQEAADLEVLVVLAGVRPEEVGEWQQAGIEPAAVVTLAGSVDAQVQAIERVLDQGRRLAARGNHVAVLVDGLAGQPPATARRALASARRIVDGGSLTVIATAPGPLGGETTVIALDPVASAEQQRPMLDARRSWTMRPELLVGEARAQTIAEARAQALAPAGPQ